MKARIMSRNHSNPQKRGFELSQKSGYLGICLDKIAKIQEDAGNQESRHRKPLHNQTSMR